MTNCPIHPSTPLPKFGPDAIREAIRLLNAAAEVIIELDRLDGLREAMRVRGEIRGFLRAWGMLEDKAP